MRINILIICVLHICIIIISCKHEPFPAGKRVYERHCENCHMQDGSGLPPMYPALVQSAQLKDKITSLPCLIKEGRQSQIMGNVYMPGVEMSTIDMSNLINYMTNNWGDNSSLSMDKIDELMVDCEKAKY